MADRRISPLPTQKRFPCAKGPPGGLTLRGDDLHFDLFGGVGGCVEGLVLLLRRRSSISWSSCGTLPLEGDGLQVVLV